MAKGWGAWGPGTRERQHASRDTISERWGERTHLRTQAQLTFNRSASLQLPTLASGVRKLPSANGSSYVGELRSRPSDPFLPFRLQSRLPTLQIEIPPGAPTLGTREVKRAGTSHNVPTSQGLHRTRLRRRPGGLQHRGGEHRNKKFAHANAA